MGKIKKFIILFLVVFFCLAILEGSARIRLGYRLLPFKLSRVSFIERDKFKVWNQKFVESRSIYFRNWPIPLETFPDTDPYPRYRFKPLVKTRLKDDTSTEEKYISWSSNSLGLRGKENDQKKQADVIRIVAFGSSTTEGTQSDNETYPVYLEELLNKEGFKVEVINTGHHGQDIDDLWAIYSDVINPLNPDIVLFYEAANNIYPGEWVGEPWNNWNEWDKAYSPLFQLLHRNSALFVFFTNMMGIEKKLPPNISHTFDLKKPKPTLSHYRNRLAEIIKLSKRQNTTFVLMTFVTIASKDLQIPQEKVFLWRDINLKWYPFTPGEIKQIYDKYSDVLKELAKEEELPIIDLVETYPKNTDYFVDHIHFTSEGNIVLAEQITLSLKDIIKKKSLKE